MFTEQQLELKAQSIIERLQAAGPAEDDLEYEIKERWPVTDYFQTARRVAAHANAARRHRIYWVIGVKETGEIVGADYNEVSAWWNQVKSHFDGVPPEIQYAIVDTKPATAIVAFATEQAPYVVSIPHNTGIRTLGITREVPWRVTTRVETATRQQLLRLFEPLTAIPRVDVTFAQIDVQYAD